MPPQWVAFFHSFAFPFRIRRERKSRLKLTVILFLFFFLILTLGVSLKSGAMRLQFAFQMKNEHCKIKLDKRHENAKYEMQNAKFKMYETWKLSLQLTLVLYSQRLTVRVKELAQQWSHSMASVLQLYSLLNCTHCTQHMCVFMLCKNMKRKNNVAHYKKNSITYYNNNDLYFI